jgi:hypothetical protein
VVLRVSEQKLGCKSVDDNWNVVSVYSVVQVGSGGTSGMISDSWRHFDGITGSLSYLEERL